MKKKLRQINTDESKERNYISIFPQEMRLLRATVTTNEVKNNFRRKVSAIQMSRQRLLHERAESRYSSTLASHTIH